MRVFSTLKEAISEIRRDVYKGTPLTSSRVQQRVGETLPGRERLAYSYSILGSGFPANEEALISLAQAEGFEKFSDPNVPDWLKFEKLERTHAITNLGHAPGDEATEACHPALMDTFEGNWLSYRYNERLFGCLEAMEAALRHTPDSRRAYWPIYLPQDSLRASAPTRVPCSLGYQAMIRRVGEEQHLMWVYLSRSCDFDTFWLSDIWFAHKMQEALCSRLRTHGQFADLKVGQVVHFIVSFHSFEVEGTEVY
jgi:hypothetical protein